MPFDWNPPNLTKLRMPGPLPDVPDLAGAARAALGAFTTVRKDMRDQREAARLEAAQRDIERRNASLNLNDESNRETMALSRKHATTKEGREAEEYERKLKEFYAGIHAQADVLRKTGQHEAARALLAKWRLKVTEEAPAGVTAPEAPPDVPVPPPIDLPTERFAPDAPDVRLVRKGQRSGPFTAKEFAASVDAKLGKLGSGRPQFAGTRAAQNMATAALMDRAVAGYGPTAEDDVYDTRDDLDVLLAQDKSQRLASESDARTMAAAGKDPLTRAAIKAQTFGGRQAAQDKAFAGALDEQAAARALLPQRQKAYEAAKDAGPWTVTMPTGEVVTTSMKGLRQAPAASIASEFEAKMEPRLAAVTDPKRREHATDTMRGVVGALEAGWARPDEAEKYVLDVLAQKDVVPPWWLDPRAIQARMDIAKAGRSAMPPGVAVGEGRAIRNETRKDIMDWMDKLGLKKPGEVQADLKKTMTMVESETNPQMQQTALLGLAQMAQKDPRMSDADFRLLVTNLGSSPERLQTIASQITAGTFGEGRMAMARELTKVISGLYRARMEAAASEARENFFGNNLYNEPLADALLRQKLGSYWTPIGGPPPKKPPLGTKPLTTPQGAAAKSKASQDAMDAINKALDEQKKK